MSKVSCDRYVIQWHLTINSSLLVVWRMILSPYVRASWFIYESVALRCLPGNMLLLAASQTAGCISNFRRLRPSASPGRTNVRATQQREGTGSAAKTSRVAGRRGAEAPATQRRLCLIAGWRRGGTGCHDIASIQRVRWACCSSCCWDLLLACRRHHYQLLLPRCMRQQVRPNIVTAVIVRTKIIGNRHVTVSMLLFLTLGIYYIMHIFICLSANNIS